MVWPFSKKTTPAPTVQRTTPLIIKTTDPSVQEKGEVSKKPQKWPKQELGEEHPFDANITEGVLKNYGLVDAMIDKYVNYVWGRGFYVTSKEANAEKAIKIIDDFNREVDMSILGRAFFKEALHKPGGYLEILFAGKKIVGLQLRNGKTMYVKRKDDGTIEGYSQYIEDMNKFGFDKKKVIPFTPDEILALHINVIGDDAYGMGMVWPNIKTIDEIRGLETSMHKIIKRKANSPMHIKIGHPTPTGILEMPTQETIDAVKNDLQTLTDKTELVSDATWDIKVVDFGKTGEKFAEVYNMDYYRLIAGFKMYEVLLGKGNIAEGLGDAQTEDLMLTVETLREQLENVLEKLYRRVIRAQGIDIHLEVNWIPTAKQKAQRIQEILMMLPVVQPAFRFELEKELAELQGIDPTLLKTPEEQAAARAEEAGMLSQAEGGEAPEKKEPKKEDTEEKKTVPQIPGENAKASQDSGVTGSLSDASANSHSSGAVPKIDYTVTAPTTATYSAQSAPEEAPSTLDPFRAECPVKEWVGFNFDEFLVHILKVLKQDKFDLLKAVNKLEREAGYLSKKQVSELRAVLEEAFKEGQTIQEIATSIKERVQPGDVYAIEAGKVGRVVAYEADRVLAIARSETVRLSNLGSQAYYEESGVDQVRWIASLGPRTCPECEAMNGTIMETSKATLPPLHAMCRCTIAAVTKYG